MTTTSSLYVLILAGGSGERFWPLSRKNRPKQLLSLFSQTTLLEETINRLEGLVERDHILILTNQDQEAAVREVARDLPPENIVAEPAKRDTAAAIALGAGWISLRDSGATMVVLPADHLIQDRKAFQATLCTAVTAARETGEVVTIGIKPTWACPGFGYIEMAGPVKLKGETGGQAVHDVARFREKPNPELAEQFLRQGNFRWNAGMFIWPLSAILSSLEQHAPELANFVQALHAGGDFKATVAERFPDLPKISIDYAIMEKAERVLMVEAGFDWDDVGSWTAVAKYLRQNEGENAANIESLTLHESEGNIVFTTQPVQVALMGVRDLIVVQTGDALLVAHKSEAEKIKHLVAKVPPSLQ
ncbi:MAG TPA: sugar phosphate nucleotidyltransferase [Chthoniobacteraceae bacterium]|nr:sugar phosphate nucleotidyltransferase [Chthoniobacteraceae bacterium]